MYNTEHLQEKWGPILDYDGLDPIKDAHRRSVTAILLENQEKELREEASFLSEQPTVNTNSGTNAGFSANATAAGPVAVALALKPAVAPELVLFVGVSFNIPLSWNADVSLKNFSWFSNRTAVTALRWGSVIFSHPSCSRRGFHFSCNCSDWNI